MGRSKHEDWDIIDTDLYEDIDPEEMYELVQEEKRKLKEKEKLEQERKAKKQPFPRWIFWTIAAAMFIQVIAILPQTYSIPALDFIKTSTTLMQDDQVREYRKAVVVIEGEDNKGTGFAISEDGYIITNYHVIESQSKLTIAFTNKGLYSGEVISTYPEYDLALLKVEGEDFPYLEWTENTPKSELGDILFIGNPLRFNGIANQGDIIGKTQLDEWDKEVYMIDAPIYRGNSGSPVMNDDGEVIAVIFATQKNEQHGRVGLAVPIDYISHEIIFKRIF
ncbi:serine protease [Gracilibacillus sp. YIM 98692]|uniref:S1C family serine protease n=1 Tax=Gracilibacillus sp. YIM 98692 TaxID=2663532 RepID=UPI0013D374A0|nr:serine protease [Gracilibacillus sp. YIM 98692]